MEIAERLSQNIIIINHGKITWTGTMDQLKGMITGDESIEDVVEKLMIDVF
jgi:ABC-type multidrug transport system ATPase subunit